MKKSFSPLIRPAVISFVLGQVLTLSSWPVQAAPRERISIDDNWRFTKGDPTNNAVSLLYDVRQSQNLCRLAQEADGNPAINQSNSL